MSSKKQRRRREKVQRHEWEYVRIDDEGNETPLEPAQARAKKPETNGRPASATRGRRPLREVKPPSWQRSLRRAVFFVPFLFIFLSFGKHPPAVFTRVAIALLYSAAFVPMFFLVDRMTYRAYQRRLGGGRG